jgi:WD40 repeat protein
VQSDRDRGALHLRCAAVAAPHGSAELWRKEFWYDRQHSWNGFRELFFSSDGSRLLRSDSVGPSGGGRGGERTVEVLVEAFAAADGAPVAEWRGTLALYANNGAASGAGALAFLNGRTLHGLSALEAGAVPVKCITASPKPMEAVEFSRDGTAVATVGRDESATIWDPRTWAHRARYDWKIGSLLSVAFAPDGLRCAAGGKNGQIVVWDLDA